MKKIYVIVLIISCALLFIVYSCLNVNEHRNINTTIVENVQNVKTNDILSFSDKELCREVAKELKLSYVDILALACYSDCFEKIYVKNNLPIDKSSFYKNLKLAKEKDFKVLNKNTNKYHTLTCKYGLESKNIELLPYKNLPKDAKPCKFCIENLPKKQKIYIPLVISTTNIKLILSDFTENLKPTRECRSFICKELVNAINNAKSTIDIAVYGYDKVPAIEFALSNAIKRGVKIRLVYDIDSKNNNIYSDTKYIANLIKDSKNDFSENVKYSNSIMHDKFYIFDSKKVITGSANMSYTDMSGFISNSVLVISSPEVTKLYEEEFNQMYEGKFHELKKYIQNKNIRIENTTLSICFSPKDDAINKTLIPLINSATKYIYIPTFLITEKHFSEALISAKQRGVDVKVIVDAVNAKSRSSKHQILRDNGIKVKTENYAGKLHSKSIIIDDKYIIVGSMNFSYSGNSKNDENLIVIKNSKFAIFYRKFFEYLWNKISDFWLMHDVSAESKYSIGSCSDGIDNDYDGKIDIQDEGCNISK